MEKPVSQSSHFPANLRLAPFITYSPIGIILALGIYFVVLKGYGLHWELIPGDLGDGRFNNYILEHFYLWVKGAGAAASYWDAPFFYPYLRVIAFSDNLLGSAPIYAFFRWLGADRETAFQWWDLCGFILNYAAAAYVLLRARLRPLAVGVGAFFFAFGLPLLSQGAHLQLFYRFGIPLASFFLLEFFRQPKLTRLVAVAFWLVWQFYLSIYLGFFLLMLLVALALLAPCFEIGISVREKIYLWPTKFKQAWLQTDFKQRIFSIFMIGLAGACFFALIWPYYKVSKAYGFSRSWTDITRMLPVFQSFLISDSAALWRPISSFFGKAILIRHEHQLFPGMAPVIMLATGLIVRFKSKNSQTAWLYFCAILLLVIATLNFNGFSLYWFIWNIPGVNSIRAVTRLQLVWMWPLAFFVAWGMDGILQFAQQKASWLLYTGALLITALLIVESAFFIQGYYPKADGIARIANLQHKLPERLPSKPVLLVAYSQNELFFLTEIDAMLLAQELGWPTMNGYSGNVPPHYRFAQKCTDIETQIKMYTISMHMDQKPMSAFYQAMKERIVPVGFPDCGPNWRNDIP